MDEGQEVLTVTVSAGVALYEGDPDAVFQKADKALYEAKRGGRNRVCAAVATGKGGKKAKSKSKAKPKTGKDGGTGSK